MKVPFRNADSQYFAQQMDIQRGHLSKKGKLNKLFKFGMQLLRLKRTTSVNLSFGIRRINTDAEKSLHSVLYMLLGSHTRTLYNTF